MEARGARREVVLPASHVRVLLGCSSATASDGPLVGLAVSAHSREGRLCRMVGCEGRGVRAIVPVWGVGVPEGLVVVGLKEVLDLLEGLVGGLR